MTGTVFLLGLIYVIFFVVLLQGVGMALPFVILIAGGLLAVQYWTSDKIALASAGARIVEPRPGSGAVRDRAAAVHDRRPADAADRDRADRHAERVRNRPQPQARRRGGHPGAARPARAARARGGARTRAVARRPPRRRRHDDGQLLRHGRRVHHPLGLLLRRHVRRRLRRRPRRQQQLGPLVHGHPARVGGRVRDLVRPHPDAVALPRVRGRPGRGHPDQVARRAWPRRWSRSPARWAASRSTTCAWPRA